MSPPSTPSKVPWIKRQLNNMTKKLNKKHPSDSKKREESYVSEPTTNYVPGREVGFSAFGDGSDTGNKDTKHNTENREKSKENIGVYEIEKPTEEYKPFEVEFPAADGLTSGAETGTDVVDHARTYGTVPFDGDLGKDEGRAVEGDVTANTALNSHPVAGLFRKD